jgi:hypothetical protein
MSARTKRIEGIWGSKVGSAARGSPEPAFIGAGVRQLNDTKTGNRNGMWEQLMKEAVARLMVEDMVAIAAYTASRKP